MKKKVWLVMLSMVLCLNGCSSVDESSQNVSVQESEDIQEDSKVEEPEAVPPQEQPTATPEVSNQDTTPEAPEAPEVSVNTSGGYLDVAFDYHYDSYYDQTSMMYGYFNTIQLHTDKYPALRTAVGTYNNQHATESQKYLDSLEQAAIAEYAEYGTEWFMGPYVWKGDMFLRRGDSQVLSFIEVCYDYAGGAHGYNYFDSVNFDVQTGEEMVLEDVIKDINSLPEILAKELTEKYQDIVFFTDPLSDAFKEYISPTDSSYTPAFTWTLDYEGVTFYFSNYEIASYADGLQQVTVSYSEYPHILEEKYFSEIPLDYVLKLNDAWLGSDIDLDRDGVTDYIDVPRIYEHDMYMSDAYNVTVNGNTFRQEKYCYKLDTYLVKANGKNYLYIQSVADSDWKSVDVYEITTTSVEYMGSFNGNVEGMVNSSEFPLTIRLDLLSTYDAEGKSFVGEDGLPVAKSGVYTINREIIITSTVDISAELVDESGNMLGATYTFPEGTDFQLMTTDGETYVDVLAEDGQRCRFYTAPEWPATINGMDAESSFEMLWYAG